MTCLSPRLAHRTPFNRANTSCSVVPLFHSLLNHVDYVLSLIAGSNVKGSMGSAEESVV